MCRGCRIVPATIDLIGVRARAGGVGGRHYRLRDCLAAMAAAEEPDADYDLRPDRLPAVAEFADRQRAGGSRRGARAAAMRVLRARRPGAAAAARSRRSASDLNPKLAIHGVVLTMYDQRTSLSDQVVDDVRARARREGLHDHHSAQCARGRSRRRTAKPVLLYDYRCSGSQAYIQLASEVIERERRMRAA